jgi:hypothetical protein
MPPSAADFANSVPLAARQALSGAQLVFDAAAVEKAVDQLAVRITVEWQDRDPVLLSLLPHGLVLAGMLLRRLVFPCRHYAVAVNTEDLPAMDDGSLLAEREVVLIAAQVSRRQRQHLASWADRIGLRRLVAVVMVGPPHAEAKPAGGSTIEVWPALRTEAQPLLGCGFDVAGYGANLPGLYHVAAPLRD